MQNNMLIALIARAVCPLRPFSRCPTRRGAIAPSARMRGGALTHGQWVRARLGAFPSRRPESEAASGSVEFRVNEQFCTASVAPRGTSFPDQKPPFKVASPRNTSGGEWGWLMHESQRYRYNAAECLRAAQQARDHLRRGARLSMALSWLSLARRDEAAERPDQHPGGGREPPDKDCA
jgi:hypothetical protein